MKVYQVFSGEENKHGYQVYDLHAVYLDKEKALNHAQQIVNRTPLDGDKLIDEGWDEKRRCRHWIAHGWGFTTICKIEEIEVIE